MNNILIKQLSELAIACQQKDIKPIICGGLGVYLSFCRKEDEIRQMIRATQDIDLMFCRQDLIEEAKRKAMAEIITEKLEYVVQEQKKHHGFKKDPDQELDILVPFVEGLPQMNYRLSIVKSVLHGHITTEAEFIDEDMRTILLSDISKEFGDNVIIYVPCPTNLMIMKLHAFNDRIKEPHDDLDRAMAHAFDIYVIIMLTNRDDLKDGQSFLFRHTDSDIIQKTKVIIENYFSNYAQAGWQYVLRGNNFYPTMMISDREERLKEASARLVRWFK
jgi:hypothetical protein